MKYKLGDLVRIRTDGHCLGDHRIVKIIKEGTYVLEYSNIKGLLYGTVNNEGYLTVDVYIFSDIKELIHGENVNKFFVSYQLELVRDIENKENNFNSFNE